MKKRFPFQKELRSQRGISVVGVVAVAGIILTSWVGAVKYATYAMRAVMMQEYKSAAATIHSNLRHILTNPTSCAATFATKGVPIINAHNISIEDGFGEVYLEEIPPPNRFVVGPFNVDELRINIPAPVLGSDGIVMAEIVLKLRKKPRHQDEVVGQWEIFKTFDVPMYVSGNVIQSCPEFY